jgi:hypothetical protein
MRWTRQRFARDGIAGWVERLVSDQQHADERCCSRTAKSCGPDAPTLASSFAEFCRPNRAMTKRYPRGDGGKRARSPGRARHKPLKPLRAGMPGDSGVPVATTRVLSTLHTGLRVQRAPGIPHALLGAEDKCKPRTQRAARFKRMSRGRHCERSEAIHSFFMWRDGLLRGACHRARVRATRWLAMTLLAVLRIEVM